MALANLTLVTLIVAILSVSSSSSNSWLRNELIRSLKNFNGSIPQPIITDILPLVHKYLYYGTTEQSLTKEQRDISCAACDGLVSFFLDSYDENGFDAAIEGLIDKICPLLGNLGIVPKQICIDSIFTYAPEFEYIAETKGLSAARLCTILLGGNHCQNAPEVNEWTVDMSNIPPKPPVIPPTLPPEGSKASKILQISDFHLDLNYTVGSNANCGAPLCCRLESGKRKEEEAVERRLKVVEEAADAGYWGAYRCDLPSWTFKDMLLHIKEQNPQGFEYIFLTGDFPPHNVWGQSREFNLAHSRVGLDLVKEVFPNQKVFPIVGNHESYPSSSFPESTVEDPDHNPKWMYDAFAEMYSDWLPEEALSVFRKDGFYSVQVRDGFRIIVVNSNFCLFYNFWLNYNFVDPGNGLAWLVQELAKAEANGEKVHILSHVPPGDHACLGSWGREYSRIVTRFENTITTQFFGHTHNDEFVVFYDADETNERPTNIGFVAPSVTTYTFVNPSYRIFTVDGPYDDASMRVLDIDTYIFNITEANMAGAGVRPKYTKLYAAKEGLEMESLLPEDYDRLAKRLANDDEFFEKYLNYFNSGGKGEPKTRRQIVCGMVTTSIIDHRKCEELMGPLL